MQFDHSFDIITPDLGIGITFGGVAGTILPVGSTAQQPTQVAGLVRFNSTNLRFEYSDGTNWTTIMEQPLVQASAPTGAVYGDIWINSTTGALSVWRSIASVDQWAAPPVNVSTATGILPVVNGGTGVTTSTGSGSTVLSASPTLTGVPVAPTAAVGTSTTQIATTAYVQGNMQPVGGGSDHVFFENDQVITTSRTITSGKNAGSFGPITVASPAVVTVPSGSVWTVV